MPQISLQHEGFDVQIQMPEHASVNAYRLADQLVDLARRLVGPGVHAQLTARLHNDLGPRGASGNEMDDAASSSSPAEASDDTAKCPACGSGAAYRKGTRSRTVEVARLGAVEIERPYLECRACGRSYTPYAAGLPDRRRYAQPAMQRPIEATLETSYRRGAEAYPESPSARTLWRILQEGPASAPVPLEPDAEAAQQGTCVADATRIPARGNEAQHSLSIAHAIGPDSDGSTSASSRPALQRHPVSARVGPETRLREAMREVPVSTLVVDGKMNMTGVADCTGRCRWHLPRSVRYLLYNDAVKGALNEQLTREVRQLAHADVANPVAARVAFTRWAAVRRPVAPQAAGHVERAAPQMAVYAGTKRADAPRFNVETTAPAEREMRELNRRFENGGQWTRSGAENLLQWHQIYRHHPERWADWFPDSMPLDSSTVSQT